MDETKFSGETFERELSIEERREFAASLLGVFTATGDLAVRTQERIIVLPEKETEEDAHTKALTETDLLVQRSFYKGLRRNHPDVALWGEEKERFVGLDSRSYSEEPEYVFLLDPIDGTRLYIDGLPLYSTIGSLLHRGKRIVSTVYIPAEEKFYIGIEGGGAFTTTKGGLAKKEPWEKLQLNNNSDSIFIGPREIDESIIKRLQEQGFQVRDIHRHYQNGNNMLDGKPWDVTWHSILGGKIAGCIDPDLNVLDQGAIAHIVQLAGGAVSYVNGEPLPKEFHSPFSATHDGLIMARDKNTHKRLIEAIRAG